MKLDKEILMQIIKEEIEAVLDESALLKKHMKDRKQKFLKKLRDMGKPARKTFNSLDPQMRSVLGQSLVDGYPGLYGDLTAAQARGEDLRPNPYGGKFHFTFHPENWSEPGSGIIHVFAIEPATGDMEFQNAYRVKNLTDELKKLAQWK